MSTNVRDKLVAGSSAGRKRLARFLGLLADPDACRGVSQCGTPSRGRHRFMAAMLILAASLGCDGVVAEGSPALLEAGKAVLKKMKRLKPGQKQAYYFEIMRGPDETIGYAAVSLSASEKDGNLTYHYTNEGILSFPSGDKALNTVTARLRANFEPIEVEVWRARITPDGNRRENVNRATIGKDKVSVSTSLKGPKEKVGQVGYIVLSKTVLLDQKDGCLN